MTERAGVLRSETGLASVRGAGRLAEKLVRHPEHRGVAGHQPADPRHRPRAGRAHAEETRGSHWREDFPATDDEHWLGHIDVTTDAITYRPGAGS